MHKLFTELLTDDGACIYACGNVDEAKQLLASLPSTIFSQIDVVLTDYRLGASGTGLDIVETVRNRQSQGDRALLPAILLTGDSAVKDLISIQQLPCATLLHKPIDFKQLTQTLLKAVKV